VEQRYIMVNWIIEVSVCQHCTLHSTCTPPILH
jgi:hypothetical protein